MRADIVPGAVFPDYELPDHTTKRRKLSELQGQHPMVLVLSRGGFCPKDRRQAEGLVELHPELEVGYCRLVAISTDNITETNEYRSGVGAHWPFLSNAGRKVQKDLDIADLDYGKAAPGSAQALYKLQEFSEGSGLERRLLELMKTRVSQINGCAFCTDMHTKDARDAGETEQRLYGLSAWRETPYYTERERAALAWAEAVTKIPQIYETDEEYKAARAQFSEEELIKLTVVVIAVNRWNWLAVAFRETVVTYKASATTV